jgi:energy-coupling factor transport system substrate-specific component
MQARAVIVLASGSAALILLALVSEAQTGLTAITVAMLGALVGLNTALRVADNTLLPLPGGFSPVFLLIILVGYSFGPHLGFLMGALTILVSEPLSPGGIGPWTPYQMLAAGWVGLGAAWLPRGRGSRLALAVYGLFWGWGYGALTNLYFWPFTLLAPDLGWQPGMTPAETMARYGRYYLVTSLAWDSMRAVGNFILMGMLGPTLLKPIERFRRKASVVWQPA